MGKFLSCQWRMSCVFGPGNMARKLYKLGAFVLHHRANSSISGCSPPASWIFMNRSWLRLALLLSALTHVLVLGLLRFIPLAALTRPAAPTSDAPVAVQLLELPPQPQPQIAQTPERTRNLPEAPTRKSEPKAPHPPASPRAPEPVTPKPVTPLPKGGTVVDLPKPVREERPDDARLVSRYDSKAQDIGPEEGGTRKPSGEHPRAMPPDIPLPERYSAGQPA